MPVFNLIKAQRVVFESSLRPSERLLLLAIIDNWSRKEPKPYPGIALLLRKTGLAKQTAIDAVDSLVRDGVLPDPNQYDEHGVKRTGVKFVYDIEKAVQNLDRLNRENRCTNQTGKILDRSSFGKKPVYPARESGVKRAVDRPKEPREGTKDENVEADPRKHTPQTAFIAAGSLLIASNTGQDG